MYVASNQKLKLTAMNRRSYILDNTIGLCFDKYVNQQINENDSVSIVMINDLF